MQGLPQAERHARTKELIAPICQPKIFLPWIQEAKPLLSRINFRIHFGARVDFSIVTPTFKQPEWLRLCAGSVLDQAGVRIEHIIQDGGDGEGLEWLGRTV